MTEKVDPAQKLFSKMRLWELPDQYVVEPTDGSSGSYLAISRVDGSMKIIGNFIDLSLFHYVFPPLIMLIFVAVVIEDIPQCTSLRVPKIQTIYGVVGMLKLLAGKF